MKFSAFKNRNAAGANTAPHDSFWFVPVLLASCKPEFRVARWIGNGTWQAVEDQQICQNVAKNLRMASAGDRQSFFRAFFGPELGCSAQS